MKPFTAFLLLSTAFFFAVGVCFGFASTGVAVVFVSLSGLCSLAAVRSRTRAGLLGVWALTCTECKPSGGINNEWKSEGRRGQTRVYNPQDKVLKVILWVYVSSSSTV